MSYYSLIVLSVVIYLVAARPGSRQETRGQEMDSLQTENGQQGFPFNGQQSPTGVQGQSGVFGRQNGQPSRNGQTGLNNFTGQPGTLGGQQNGALPQSSEGDWQGFGGQQSGQQFQGGQSGPEGFNRQTGGFENRQNGQQMQNGNGGRQGFGSRRDFQERIDLLVDMLKTIAKTDENLEVDGEKQLMQTCCYQNEDDCSKDESTKEINSQNIDDFSQNIAMSKDNNLKMVNIQNECDDDDDIQLIAFNERDYEAELDKWAKAYNVENERNKMKAEEAARFKKAEKEMKEMIANLPKVYDLWKKILADKSKTRKEMAEAILKLSDEHPAEVRNLLWLNGNVKELLHDYQRSKGYH
ncbi:unnamed protein product [Caenorhabditis bovis]|uniref:SXP/RAL-2 family protein Ani s 5-like cation-binding domain-containing protein n=1 Tax=Caenorhabditis bovis TaxID=2654633 RepID=A0A8S1F7E8_9PELO|nr:unnamed protein product [Caenorhabditis bovis]